MENLICVSMPQFLGNPLIVIGMILLILGVSTLCLAKRVTRVARQSNKVNNDDKIYVAFKIIGLLLMLAGLICISVAIIIYIVNR